MPSLSTLLWTILLPQATWSRQFLKKPNVWKIFPSPDEFHWSSLTPFTGR